MNIRSEVLRLLNEGCIDRAVELGYAHPIDGTCEGDDPSPDGYFAHRGGYDERIPPGDFLCGKSRLHNFMESILRK